LGVAEGVADWLSAVMPAEAMLDFDGDGTDVIPFETKVDVAVAVLVAAMMMPPSVVATLAVGVASDSESEPELVELPELVLLPDEVNLLVVRTM